MLSLGRENVIDPYPPTWIFDALDAGAAGTWAASAVAKANHHPSASVDAARMKPTRTLRARLPGDERTFMHRTMRLTDRLRNPAA